MIRILIADDHSIVRQGLKQIVSECPGMVVAGEAGSGQEALDLVRARDFDVAIIDIAMPGRGGLEILRELKTGRPPLKVIVLSMYAEEQYAIRSLRDGAGGISRRLSPRGWPCTVPADRGYWEKRVWRPMRSSSSIRFRTSSCSDVGQ